MKFLSSSLCFAAVAGSALFCSAQNPRPAAGTRPAAAAPATAASVSGGTAVAVIDINEVFEKHLRFKAAMDDIKNDIQNYETQVIERRKQATTMSEKLKEYQAGSPEYKNLEAQIAQIMADLQVDMALKKKEYMEREAKVYYTAYNEVLQQVTDFANRNTIGLVLRFNSEEIDPGERGSVLQGVNRTVVYQRNLNITGPILERLNRGAAPEEVGARPGIPMRR